MNDQKAKISLWLHIFFTVSIIKATLAENEIFDYSAHPCRRDCKTNDKAMICRYKFEVSQYSTMGKACYDCPKNITDCFDSQCIVADGVRKTLIVVNKQLPGPLIEVCKGDRIIVDVRNLMTSESTTVHWHGLHQRNTPFMDGVPYVTQCPILPGKTFQYDFLAETAGTSFWHSHSPEQKADGMFGGLIIREAQKDHLYDIDEHIIIFNDWIDKSHSDSWALHNYAGEVPEPYNILINGLGRSQNSSIKLPIPIFEVEKGKKYRFRVINAGAQDCPTMLSIDNHQLLIINSDGYDLKPVKVDSIRTLAGERYDFIIEANQKIDNYWLRIKGIDGSVCEERKLHQESILRYKGALEVEPTSSAIYEVSTSQYTQLNPLNKGLDSPLSIVSLNCSLPDDISNTRSPDHQFYIVYNSFRAHQQTYDNNAVRIGKYRDVPGRFAKTHWRFNHINYKSPSFPLLTQSDMIDPREICNSTTVGDCVTKYCECTHVIQVNINSVVELVIVDEGHMPVNHPMHLHGHSFRVVGMERLKQPVSANLIKQLDKEGKIKRKLKAAPIKDTITVPDNGYTIVRFHANNPGYWLFHCHYERHAHLGMELVFKVGNETDFPQIPKNIPKC